MKMFYNLPANRAVRYSKQDSAVSGLVEDTNTSLSIPDTQSAGVKAMVKNMLATQKKELEKNQRMKIKNIKRIATLESVEFVKRASEEISRSLTKEH